MASQPVTGKGSLSASYSTSPTSWRSCSRVRSAFISSTVRAPPVDAGRWTRGRRRSGSWRHPAECGQSVQQYVETLGSLSSQGAPMDASGRHADRSLRAGAAHRRPGGVPPAGRGPRHRPGPPGQAGRVGRGHRLGPRAEPRGARLPGDGLPHPRDPPGRGPRRGRGPPRRHRRGARGLHDHRRRRHVVPRRRAHQRRPPAGHRPGAHPRRDRPLHHRDRPGDADPAPRATAGARLPRRALT